MKVIGKILGIVTIIALLCGEIVAHSFVVLNQITVPEIVKSAIISDDSIYEGLIKEMDKQSAPLINGVRDAIGVTTEEANAIVVSKPAKELAGEMAYYLSGYIRRADTMEVTQEKYHEMVNNALVQIRTTSGLTETQTEQLGTYLTEKVGAKYLDIFSSVKKLYSENSLFSFRFINLINIGHIATILACIVLALLTALFIWSFGRTFIYSGLITLVCGIPMLMIGINLVDYKQKIFQGDVIRNIAGLLETIGKFPIMVDAVISLIISIWLIIKGIQLIHRRRQKRREKEATIRAEQEAAERKRVQEENRRLEQQRRLEEEKRMVEEARKEGRLEDDAPVSDSPVMEMLKDACLDETEEGSEENKEL
ncbi:MAG: hypothetical protein II704_01150 [Erysipelotrichaceae bacterium]|nr:hypothetical protein [Erysipelotrichaceae bacterium]